MSIIYVIYLSTKNKMLRRGFILLQKKIQIFPLLKVSSEHSFKADKNRELSLLFLIDIDQLNVMFLNVFACQFSVSISNFNFLNYIIVFYEEWDTNNYSISD